MESPQKIKKKNNTVFPTNNRIGRVKWSEK